MRPPARVRRRGPDRHRRGRCASAPGTAPGAGTCATNWFTAVATFFESGGTAESPANTAAAAISVEAALVGSAAARWMAGPMLCTADKPGACNPSIGSGGAGSALATGVIPPSSSAADEPTAAAAPANVVLIDDMVPPICGCGCRCAPGRRRHGSADSGISIGATGRGCGGSGCGGSGCGGSGCGRACGRRGCRCRQQTGQRCSGGHQRRQGTRDGRQQVLRRGRRCGGRRERVQRGRGAGKGCRGLRKGDRSCRGRRRRGCGCCCRGGLRAAEDRREPLHELRRGGRIGCELLEERQTRHARCRCGRRRLGCGRRAEPQRNSSRTRGSDHAGGKHFSGEFHGFSNPLTARLPPKLSSYWCYSSDTCGGYSNVTDANGLP